MMKRMFVLFKRYNREIINIDSDVDALTARTLWSLHGPLESKDALVGMCLSEAEIFQPREECALPSTPGLSHSIDRLEYAANLFVSVGP